MSKVGIIYWSSTGNTEAMAQAVEEGAKAAGADVEIMEVADADVDKALSFDVLALGCRMDDAFRSALLINYRQNKNGWQRAGPHMRQQHSELGSTQPPKPRLSLSCW